MSARIDHYIKRPMKNTHHRCWSHIVRVFLAKEEREVIQRLLREFGIKYTKEKRRLRVAYKIPWGVDFDILNPVACPKAGTWNGALELFCQVWKDSTLGEKREFVQQALPLDSRRN